MLELQPHGQKFAKKVTVELAVAPGDETKPMVVIHQDVDATKPCKWEVLQAKPQPVGPGRVAVQLEAFCIIMPVFPFSGMNKLVRKEWGTDLPTWRTLRNGLAVDALCQNEGCAAAG